MADEPVASKTRLSLDGEWSLLTGISVLAAWIRTLYTDLLPAPQDFESPDIKVGLSSANRHNLRGVSSPSIIE